MKNIVIITESYPYKGGEQFLYNEFIELSKHYKTVYFFPLNKSELAIKLPDNYIINDALNSNSETTIKTNLSKYYFLILSFFLTELIGNKKSILLLKNFRYHFAFLKKSISNNILIQKEFLKLNISTNDTFVSTWMNSGALTLSILKKKKKITDFSFRVNGYDIFEERHKGNYMPFQIVNFKYCKKVIVLSKAGFNHLTNKTKYNFKLFQNYAGQYDIGLNKITKTEITTIVSCSSLIELKRVNLIVRALKKCTSRINWIHFGDGTEMNEISSLCKQLPENVNYNLKGNVSNLDIINFYETNAVNFFIHVSRTEGLGMALIEAQSFGIPIIACGVGGVTEIVNKKTGVILDKTISSDNLRYEIESFINSDKNNMASRIEIKKHFNEKFNIKKNIILFINSIES